VIGEGAWQVKSRSLRTARRLAVAADCLRPAVLCIAGDVTCRRWFDAGHDYSLYFHYVKATMTTAHDVPLGGPRAPHEWDAALSALSAMANIKGAMLLVVRSRNILTVGQPTTSTYLY